MSTVARSRILARVVLWAAMGLLTASQAAAEPVTKPGGTTERRDTTRPAPTAAVQPLDLNAADQLALTRLPGIGPARARAILELRKRLGRFSRVQQLMRVRGIGRKTFRRLRPLVSVQTSSGSTATSSDSATTGK